MKTKDEILNKYGWDGKIPYEDTITMHFQNLFLYKAYPFLPAFLF